MKIGKTNVYSWPTWKKKFRPKIVRIQDSSLGYVSHIKQTMIRDGFKYTEIELATGSDAVEINGGKNPLDIVKLHAPSLNATYIVYNVWRHSRGYTKYLNIYYI